MKPERASCAHPLPSLGTRRKALSPCASLTAAQKAASEAFGERHWWSSRCSTPLGGACHMREASLHTFSPQLLVIWRRLQQREARLVVEAWHRIAQHSILKHKA